MKLRRLVHRLRTLLTITTIVGFVSLLGVFIYLHNVGLPNYAKVKLLRYLKKNDIHLTFDSLKYKLNKGLVAEGVQLFENIDDLDPLVEADELIIKVDKTKLLRGVVELDSVAIENGHSNLNMAPDIANAPALEISDIHGAFSLSNNGQLESKAGISVTFEGVQFILKGRAWSSRKAKEKPPKPTLEEQQKRLDIINSTRSYLKKLSWTSDTPPTITLQTDGDLSKIDDIELFFSLTSEDLTYNDVTISNLNIEGDLNRQLIQLHTFRFDDQQGSFSAQANLSLASHEGTFAVESSIAFKDFIQKVGQHKFADNVFFHGANTIKATGSLTLPHAKPEGRKEKFSAKLIGKAECRNVSYFDANFDYIGTEFSWRNNSLFLEKLQAYHGDSEFNGRLLMTESQIKFSSNSSLPPRFFLPFLKNRGFDRTLSQVQLSSASNFNISASGTINRQDITDWQAEGDIYIGNISYRDTKIEEANVDFSLTADKAIYRNASVLFDHRNWHKYNTYGGDPNGHAKADLIEISRDKQTLQNTIKVTGAEGSVWATPVIRLFDQKASDQFEKFNLQAPVTLRKSNLQFQFKRPQFHTTGTVHLDHLRLAGYDITDGQLELDLKRGNAVIRNIAATLDYSSYTREKNQSTATDGKFSIDSLDIKNDLNKSRHQVLSIKGIEGTLWPAPATALFASKAARAVENLPFTSPIESSGSDLTVIQRGDDWTTILDLDIASMAYNKVPILNGKSTVTINNGNTQIDQLSLDFDYSNYPKFTQLGGLKRGSAAAKSIHISKNETIVKGLTGTLWPGQAAALFSPEVASTLEDLDFSSPVESSGSDFHFAYGTDAFTKATLNLGKFSYHGIPLTSASAQMMWTENEGLFTDISATIDNRNYPARKEFGGPNSSNIKSQSLTFDLRKNHLRIDKLTGNFYPGRLLALFSNDVATEADCFRFATPPLSSTSGTLDLNEKSTSTNLTTTLSAKAFRYHFLDADVNGTSASATIKTSSRDIQFSNIKMELLDSKKYSHESKKDTIVYPLSGNFNLNIAGKTPSYSGTLAVNRISIASLAKTYKFEDLNKGTFSTLFQFRGQGDDVKFLNTSKTNTFFIRNSNLASIPLLGPLSLITKEVGKVANQDRFGYSLIKTASGSYSITNGVLKIHSLAAKSSSLSLAGAGTYNISSERVDMRFKITGFKSGISLLEIIRPIIQRFPIVKGTMKYKAYGKLDDLKVLPDL